MEAQVRCDVFELVQTFQATPAKQDLDTSQEFFSNLSTRTPITFIWESPTQVAGINVAQLSFSKGLNTLLKYIW